MADRGGFEPPNDFHRCALSKRVPSTAQPPVQRFFFAAGRDYRGDRRAVKKGSGGSNDRACDGRALLWMI